MEVVYVPELYLYISLIFGILSSVFIMLDVGFSKKNLVMKIRVAWWFFALLFFWGPSLFIWIVYEIKYRSED